MPASLRLTALLLTVLPPALTAQGEVSAGRPAAADAAIRIYSPTGSLRITAWPHDSVSVRGRVDPGLGRFYIGGTREALKLGVESPEGQPPEGTADLDVRVPDGARLWVKTATADLEITAGGGTVEVTGVSGRVRVGGTAQSVSVETLDGNVELACEAGVARARTASGTIVLRGVMREIDASTVSGPLLVGMEGKIARARLETVSSEIAFKGDFEPDGRLDAETHGGDIELRLPTTMGAAFHVVSYGGGLRNELVPASAVRPGQRKGEWRFTTGTGGVTVDVRTFKGTVTLKERG